MKANLKIVTVISATTLLGAVGVARAQRCPERQLLERPSGQPGQEFGGEVEFDAAWLMAGSPGADGIGAVEVFARDETGWIHAGSLSGASLDANSQFGHHIRLMGEWCFVGSPGDSGSSGVATGTVQVFRLHEGEWSFAQELSPSIGAVNDSFGISLASEGRVLVVGADRSDAGEPDGGAVFAFELDGDAWTESAVVIPNDPEEGARFGLYEIGLRGGQLVVSATRKDESGFVDAGAIYVFGRECDAWVQTQKLVAAEPANNRHWGNAVAIDGDWLAVGTIGYGVDMYAREEADGQWAHRQFLSASAIPQSDGFADFLAMDDGLLAIGASRVGGNAGVIHLFEHRPLAGGWTWNWAFAGSGTDEGDLFGQPIALRGAELAAGARGAMGLGAVYCFDLASCVCPVDLDGDGDQDADDFFIFLDRFVLGCP
ncbi:MAG: hypothetical protein H6811_05150 [Phycisphaeraceae bacterium]|nr:hypothetical protein [Phycisphaeraceae bacterium]